MKKNKLKPKRKRRNPAAEEAARHALSVTLTRGALSFLDACLPLGGSLTAEFDRQYIEARQSAETAAADYERKMAERKQTIELKPVPGKEGVYE